MKAWLALVLSLASTSAAAAADPPQLGEVAQLLESRGAHNVWSVDISPSQSQTWEIEAFGDKTAIAINLCATRSYRFTVERHHAALSIIDGGDSSSYFAFKACQDALGIDFHFLANVSDAQALACSAQRILDFIQNGGVDTQTTVGLYEKPELLAVLRRLNPRIFGGEMAHDGSLTLMFLPGEDLPAQTLAVSEHRRADGVYEMEVHVGGDIDIVSAPR